MGEEKEKRTRLSRREFLKLGLSGLVGAAGYGLIKALGEGAYVHEHLRPAIDARGEDFYRGFFTYDSVIRTTCAGNCTQACGWRAYVRGGVLIKTEPAADYDRFDPVAKKAYLPRGCMRGASYPRYIYGPMRVKTPLIRVGPRGSGQFRRASWDEALEYIAERLLKIIREDGAEAIALFCPIPSYNYVSAAGGYRLGNLLGATGPLSFYDWYCDLPAGEPQTWGVQTEECEEWDWLNARLIIVWGANPAESRIAAAHFLTEAKYRGTKIIAILTDYNGSAKLADIAVSPKPGTDAALALGIARELIARGWYNEDYVVTFTDLPFLVRQDTGQFLRESDLREGGSPYKLYVWDKLQEKPVLAPGTLGDDRDTLDWQTVGITPALEFAGEVLLRDGQKVSVKTVWTMLREILDRDYTLEKVTAITGIHPEVVALIARELHERHPAMIIEGGGCNHWYHNDLNNRAMILLMALTGNVGVNGGGFHQYTGQYRVWLKGLPQYIKLAESKACNTTLFVWTHFDKQLWRLGMTWEEICHAIETGQLKKLPDGSPVGADPNQPFAYRQYLLLKALAKGWMPVFPAPPKRPRGIFIWRGNFVNNAKGGYRVLEWFKDEKKLDLVVAIDFRMSTSALFADVVLPAATWYEKFDLETTPLHPYLQVQQPCIRPPFEAKHDFEIFRLLAKKIQDKARAMRAMGVWEGQWYDATRKVYRDYTQIYDLFIDRAGKEHPFFAGQGEGALDTPEKVAHFILRHSPIIFPDPQRYREKREAFAPELRKLIEAYLENKDADAYAAGLLKLAKEGPIPFPALQPDRPHNPFRENVVRKLPWPAGGKYAPELTISKYPCVIPVKAGKTLTGRQQFYLDHSYFIALGEALPVYKPPEVDTFKGKPAPLKLNTPHGRWRTHSTFSDNDILLYLQRFEATVLINPLDAKERGITDGDVVEVINDYGRLICRAKLVPGIRRGEVRIDHAWEWYQYRDGYFNILTPVRPNPTTAVRYPEADGAPDYHLKFGWNLWGVCGNECDTSVEVRKVK
ncbi:molybdopterin oxidoreductase [Ammonifex degensii KC4]|uniref:Molybdopterin oxidoreductase n=1 Tax=Ammonifex degensii (strain DSM 10501 / KC4) TaxID=429009 RepID=C9R9K4_AMMDK|nr:molybdopterin oxidoreductase [Ammonifex degensii KC4]